MKGKPVFCAAIGICVLAFSHVGADPYPPNCTCTITIQSDTPCSDAHIRWCPAGDMDLILFDVNVRDEANEPVFPCDVSLELTGAYDAQNELGSNVKISISGHPFNPTILPTDPSGDVRFEVTGGGCGHFRLQYRVTADPEWNPVVICDDMMDDWLCAKSPDLNGDMTVNFFDTFLFMPQLMGGFGYCGDLNCDGTVVNFFDIFQYLPHVGHTGSGYELIRVTYGDCYP